MSRYVYAYNFDLQGADMFFRFGKFPDILSTIPSDKFSSMNSEEIQRHAHDAILTALQTRMVARQDVPEGDDLNVVLADGFVILSAHQAVKLELYKLYKENCRSVLDFSRKLGKSETATRRLLDLNHRSVVSEIEAAVAEFGKSLVPSWTLVITPRPNSGKPHGRSLHAHL